MAFLKGRRSDLAIREPRDSIQKRRILFWYISSSLDNTIYFLRIIFNYFRPRLRMSARTASHSESSWINFINSLPVLLREVILRHEVDTKWTQLRRNYQIIIVETSRRKCMPEVHRRSAGQLLKFSHSEFVNTRNCGLLSASSAVSLSRQLTCNMNYAAF